MTRITAWFTQTRRAWIYRTLVAAGPVLVAHHVVDGSMVTLYLAVVAEVLGVGLAAANTPATEG